MTDDIQGPGPEGSDPFLELQQRAELEARDSPLAAERALAYYEAWRPLLADQGIETATEPLLDQGGMPADGQDKYTTGLLHVAVHRSWQVALLEAAGLDPEDPAFIPDEVQVLKTDLLIIMFVRNGPSPIELADEHLYGNPLGPEDMEKIDQSIQLEHRIRDHALRLFDELAQMGFTPDTMSAEQFGLIIAVAGRRTIRDLVPSDNDGSEVEMDKINLLNAGMTGERWAPLVQRLLGPTNEVEG